MTFLCKAVASLCLLLAALTCSSCAPVGLKDDDICADAKETSLELNHLAKHASVQARNGSMDVSKFLFVPDWIEAEDNCDPGALSRDSTPCVAKLDKILNSYKSVLDQVAKFKKCSKFVSPLQPVLDRLSISMSGCNQIKKKSRELSQPILTPKDQPEELLCHYILDRLFSFSILTARVFAGGHPSQYSQSSAHKCM